MEALYKELSELDPSTALQVVSRWLIDNNLKAAEQTLQEDFETNPLSVNPSSKGKPRDHQTPPPAEALPVPGTSTRPGRLFDAEPVDPSMVSETLLMKPDPVFHGERDERKREAADIAEFQLTVHFDALTSGLESETHFRVEERQIIAGRYVVIQYLGSGTFCHTVQCEDLKGSGSHRFVCVKVSKNTKDIFDQNLWEVKLLKMLASRVSSEERKLLPQLLNVFYFRETLFIVYELLRDNLYHIYKYIEECQLPKYFTVDRLREVARQCLLTLQCLHSQEVIHCDLKPENILISSLTMCKVKVIDYGNAYLHHDQRCSYVQSRAYRAPEVVLGLPYSTKVDMWSLGCILMELFTGKLLFDNRSVQALLASHITLMGPLPPSLIREGQLSEHFFASETDQTLVGKHDGRICRFRPHKSSISALLAQHSCSDQDLASFIGVLMKPDPKERAAASDALKHPFLQTAATCPPYRLDSASSDGEAGQRLLQKYKSLENVESPKRSPHGQFAVSLEGELGGEGEVPGPATPTSFREQCYLDRENVEKKRSRKAGAARPERIWKEGSGANGVAGGE
eukprot:CAMPEP_0181211450 /NCGR_PEP_ID=MMETSP1096-20121128/23790_1 /TAXON_ID=156174 ORGANISM="Chrysochromulina ericina, Strain CCMP281" /NCGR_SAMPLE_ID=MMETSP1096 /ASSEMBLY_ACC=CAM_ASM_000453 /LENGTH=568 /DNA_ID=CAMNT_0023302847 /DNA_START=52 /DNA_END=1758 /DNA_ORIENTATION=+